MKRKGIFTTENTENAEVNAVASVRSVVNTEDLPDGFQMTEPVPLPEEWRVVRLGELVEKHLLLIRGGFPQGQYNEAGNGVPHLRPFNINNDGSLDLSQIKYIAPPSDEDPHWLLPNDVIFNNTNSEELVGKTALFDRNGRFVLSNHMTLLRILEPNQVDAYWLSRQLHYFWYLGLYKSLCRRHVNQASISLERLKGIPIPLPTLPEQRAIVYVLRTVQRAKEATEGVIAALKELKKSLMQHLLTYGPVPATEREHVALQESEIGPLPAHWQVVRLGEIVEVRGGTAFPPEYQGRKGGKYPFYKVSDMNLPGNEIYMQKANNWLDEQTVRILRAKPFVKNTVIFPKIGAAIHTNKKRILTTDALVDNNVMGVTICEYEQCHTGYLFYWFESIDIGQFSSPGPLPSITVQAVKGAILPLPPLDEQREIARMLQAVDARIAAEQARRAGLEELFKTLLHELMSGRRRVYFTTEYTENTEK